jgi:hypothetical protein
MGQQMAGKEDGTGTWVGGYLAGQQAKKETRQRSSHCAQRHVGTLVPSV